MKAIQKVFLILISLCLTSCLNIYESKKKVSKDSILFLEINGLITSAVSENFMGHVRDYASKDEIKGVLIRVNSPGGTVGASQEINRTVKDIKSYYKKPVVVSGGDVVASGGVYSIISADQIFLSPGTLFGSIGVLMQFQNLSELIRWAKIEIYALKAGEFKDSGNPFRGMTLRERELFENTLDTVLSQFKEAIVKGRGLEEKVVQDISDGRIMTGEEALELGLVDHIGSLNEAVRAIGQASGLGSDPKLFSPVSQSPFMKYFGGDGTQSQSFIERLAYKFFNLYSLSGHILYVWPSYLSPQ